MAHRLGDFRAVVVGAVEVRPDRLQRHAEARGAGLVEQLAEFAGGDFQQGAGRAGFHQQLRLLQQAFVVQAGRAGQRRQAGQAGEAMPAEHAFLALGNHRHQAAAGEFGEPVQVEQLVLREQHQQDAVGVFQQAGLDPAG
ncbi:hypothetical protein D9M71_417370 [compost metagenome]